MATMNQANGQGEEIFDDDGDNLIETGVGFDTVIGASGNDTISTGIGFDLIDLRADSSGANEVQGGKQGDTIFGGGGSETLGGGQGHDSIDGGAGDDIITGGKGKDTMTGGDGADTFVFYEESGADIITDFDASTDFIKVVSDFNGTGIAVGADVLALVTYADGNAILDLGGSNRITLEGVAADSLTADNFIVFSNEDEGDDDSGETPEPEVSVGTEGDDLLEGTEGAETLFGAAGNDTLTGGDGDDTVRGGSGDDSIEGGAGDDYLVGGRGNDTMTGGDGADRFLHLEGQGEDVILDFEMSDRLVLQAEYGDMLYDAASLLDAVLYTEEGAVIEFSEGDSVTLMGVAEGSLTADNFEIIG